MSAQVPLEGVPWERDASVFWQQQLLESLTRAAGGDCGLVPEQPEEAAAREEKRTGGHPSGVAAGATLLRRNFMIQAKDHIEAPEHRRPDEVVKRVLHGGLLRFALVQGCGRPGQCHHPADERPSEQEVDEENRSGIVVVTLPTDIGGKQVQS